jgi:hypothetical protein
MTYVIRKKGKRLHLPQGRKVALELGCFVTFAPAYTIISLQCILFWPGGLPPNDIPFLATGRSSLNYSCTIEEQNGTENTSGNSLPNFSVLKLAMTG